MQGNRQIHREVVKIFTLLFLGSPSLQPAPFPVFAINYKVLLSVSRLSSFHHEKEVKIPLTLTPHHCTFIPSFSLILTAHLISFLPFHASTSPSHFFACYLYIYPSGKAISPSFFLPITLLVYLPASLVPLSHFIQLSVFFWSAVASFSFCQWNER